MSEFYSLGNTWHMFFQMVNTYVSQPKQPERIESEPGCFAMKFI